MFLFIVTKLDNKTDGYQLKIVSKAANLRAFNENFLIPVKMVAIPGLIVTAIIIIIIKLCGFDMM